MSTAAERVRAYVDAIPTLYDDDNPMPDGLTIDTATTWSAPPSPRDCSHDLTYADLTELLEFIEEHERPCGIASVLSGYQTGPCIERGKHVLHCDAQNLSWAESVR